MDIPYAITDWHEKAPWRTRAVSIIALADDGFPCKQAFTLEEKRAILKNAGACLVLWTGKYYTEARIAGDADDLAKIAEYVA